MTSGAGRRYSRVSPREHPRRPDSYARRLSGVVTPLFGSRLVFPRIFDRAVERLLDGDDDVLVLPEHARWYFGRALSFDVDPARLSRRISDFVRERGGPHWVGTSFLDGADWSGALLSLARSPVHREMSELVAADLEFKETQSYRNMLAGAHAARPVRRNGVTLAGRAEIDAYFRYCVELIRSMRKHGVVPRRDFGNFGRRWLKHRDARPADREGAERDIGIAINADGELIRHLGGKHRTAIAQTLRLPTVPVEVRLVHVGWIAAEMSRAGLPAHYALVQGLARLARENGPQTTPLE